MHPVYQASYDVLKNLHEGCLREISGLTQEELDWHVNREMNSVAVLAAHIAGAERYWMMDVLMRESSGRDRNREFATADLSAQILKKRLDSALDDVRSAFERLDVVHLTETRTSPRDGRKCTVAWAIAHVVEHTALHLGHMQITRQWVRSRQP